MIPESRLASADASSAAHVTIARLAAATHAGITECAEIGHPLSELQILALWRMTLDQAEGLRDEHEGLLAVGRLLRRHADATLFNGGGCA